MIVGRCGGILEPCQRGLDKNQKVRVFCISVGSLALFLKSAQQAGGEERVLGDNAMGNITVQIQLQVVALFYNIGCRPRPNCQNHVEEATSSLVANNNWLIYSHIDPFQRGSIFIQVGPQQDMCRSLLRTT